MVQFTNNRAKGIKTYIAVRGEALNPLGRKSWELGHPIRIPLLLDALEARIDDPTDEANSLTRDIVALQHFSISVPSALMKGKLMSH